MNLVYDNFGPRLEGWDPNAGKSLDKSGFRNLQFMTPAQLTAWNAAFDPKNEALRKANLTGKDLVRWKYQRYIKNYLRCIKGVDENIGRMLAWLKETGLDKNTISRLLLRPGLLPRRSWLVRQTLDVRRILPHAADRQMARRHPARHRQHQPGSRTSTTRKPSSTSPGADIPDDMQGRSLVPLLKGENPEWRDSLYYHYFDFPSVHKVAKHFRYPYSPL